MFRLATALGVLAAVCATAAAENRSLEENVLVSPVVLKARIGKPVGSFKAGAVTYKKVAVVALKVARAVKGRPKEGATLTVWTADPPKKGEEFVLFLGSPDKNGYRLHGTAKAKEFDRVRKLVALDARAEKELGGKDKLLAAIFFAHRLRPVLRAAAEGRGLTIGAAVPDAQKEKILAIFAEALGKCTRKGVSDEHRRLTDLLRRVLSGKGGLPEYRTRTDTLTRYWANRLKTPAQRKNHRLFRLALSDKPVAAKKPRIVGRLRGPVVVRGVPYRPIRRPPRKPAPKPCVVPPPEARMGQAVGGLALGLRTDRRTYNLRERPTGPVEVTAIFRNTGKTPLRLNTYLVFARSAEIYVIGPDGRPRLYADRSALRAPQLPAMGPWSFRELKPGETVEFTEKIPASFFRRNGEHQLCVVYKNTHGKEFGVPNAWTGEVVSPRVPVKVFWSGAPAPEPTPPPPPKTPPKPPAPAPERPGRVQVQLRAGAGQSVRVEVRVGADGAVQRRVIVNGKVIQEEQKQ